MPGFKISKQRLRELVLEEIQNSLLEEKLNESKSEVLYSLYLGIKDGSVKWPQFVAEITKLLSNGGGEADNKFDAHAFAQSREEE